uniref:Uncharacterized protein n=1 Tax=Meloidogyne enterolobii TaxID=390850 RepID=A0A6V7Y1W9_MELEN|nr:unnamed protein product [Meloidogyne enterolobii]
MNTIKCNNTWTIKNVMKIVGHVENDRKLNLTKWTRGSYSTFYLIWLRQIEPNSANDLVNTQYRIYVYINGVYKDIIRFSIFFQKILLYTQAQHKN